MGEVERILAIVGSVFSVLAVAWGMATAWVRWRGTRGVTWDDALRAAESVLNQVKAGDWKPDAVIGLGRSGGIWGGWLAGNLGSLPFAVVDDHYAEGGPVLVEHRSNLLSTLQAIYPPGSVPDHPKILLVEGATSTGRTPDRFREAFANEIALWDIRLAVLFLNPVSTAQVHFVGRIGPERWPSRFPWHKEAAYRPALRDLRRRRDSV